MIEFELLGEKTLTLVCAFFNMGSNREKPHIGRQSRYFKAWTIANGELPKKGEKMIPSRFCEEQIFSIEVEDCIKDSEEKRKTDAEVYSRVNVVISADRKQSSNHESGITQSTNQVINQSSRPRGAPAERS